MLTIDGSRGEGGGQILRTSLSLSLMTGTPFRIRKIRAGRKKPGLLRQHLTAVNAAASIGQAEVIGASPGSQDLTFHPGSVTPGIYNFSVGTAGSTTLVLQAVLPALLTAGGPSTLVLEGGTHNPAAPPFDFLEKAFLPLVNRMGPGITATLERPGFFPAGGGLFRVTVNPAERLLPLHLNDRGEVRGLRARALVSNLPLHIARRELRVIGERLAVGGESLQAEKVKGKGPGNIVTIEVECEHLTEIFTGFGERGLPAEKVAERAVEKAREYIASGAPVGDHLADQLLLPLSLAGGGSFRTLEPSPHTRTNREVICQFLDIRIEISQSSDRIHQIQVGGS